MCSWWTNLAFALHSSSKKSRKTASNKESPKQRKKRIVNEILASTCARDIPLLMGSTELSSSWQGVFKSYNATSITIEIKLNEVRALLDTGAICSISFNYKSQPHIFLTTVKASKLIDDDMVELELFIPDAIESAGRPALFRVPVLQALGVAASVSIETDRCLDAEIKDINADGARVCLSPDDFAKVKIGDGAVITLSLHDVTLTRATNIRHTDTRNHAIGLHFLFTSDEREEEALRTIVREAEAFYMRRVQRLD